MLYGSVGRVGLRSSIAPFSPAALFAAGEVGGWYDPSDLTTLFQDAAGTTPVTAVEQAVGLMLDKRNGLGIGTELISNNTFASDTVWTKGTGWSIGSGVATKTAGTASVLSQSVAVQAGVTYRLVYNITLTAGTITPQLTGGSTVSGTARSATGAYVENITAVSGNVTLAFSADASFAGTVDNVYLKRVSGNDAFQTTSTARPVLSALVNLLTYTEQFDNAAWTKSNVTVTANGSTAPDGTATGDRIVESNDGIAPVNHSIAAGVTLTIGVQYVFSFYAKGASSGRYVTVGGGGIGGAAEYPIFNVASGTVDLAPTTTIVKSASISSASNGWYRCSIVFVPTTTTANAIILTNSATDNANISYIGNGASGVDIWGADLRPANAGVGLPSYQRVGAATDYDTTGFPLYLRFDGTDDSMATGTINPGSVDKAQVFAGVRKLSDAATAPFVELSTVSTFDGTIALFAPYSSANTFAWRSRGTASTDAVSGAIYPSPITSVLTGIGDIAGDNAILRVNGTQAAQSTADQGTGNYLSYPLYIGRRGGTTLPFNGNLYSLIIRFSATNLDAATITATETWVNQRTKAF